MNEENNPSNTPSVDTPNYEGEEMKMPENNDSMEPAAAIEPERSAINGPVLAVLVVVLILILGGLYYWFTTMNNAPTPPPPAPPVERPTPVENNEPESTSAEAQTESLGTVSTSDEMSALEADVESTNLDSLNAELNAIDAELESALGEQ